MQMEVVEIFKAVSRLSFVSLFSMGHMLQQGCILTCGASPCPPEWDALPPRNQHGCFRFRPCRYPPLMHYLQLTHMGEPAQAERAPLPAGRTSHPCCLHSHEPTAPMARQTQQRPSPCHCPEMPTGQPKPSVIPQPDSDAMSLSTSSFHLQALPIPLVQEKCRALLPTCTGSCIHLHQPCHPHVSKELQV